MSGEAATFGRFTQVQMSPIPQIPSTLRVFYPFLLLFTFVSPSHASGKCFSLPPGVSIVGGEYRRLRNVNHRECAMECRDDPSCMAYEWRQDTEHCYLKSRSLSGEIATLNEAWIIGFCLDENDEIRDRFRDHVIRGPEVAKQETIDGDDCRDFCIGQPEADIYSWTPKNPDNDEETEGTCTCVKALRSLTLEYNSFSGILPPRRHPRRLKL